MPAIGVIINNKSNRSASLLDDLLKATQSVDDIIIEVLDGINGLGRALDKMGQHNIEVLILAGGDGTMQAAVTDILNNNRFTKMPAFVALPCGMTNVIANDCGLKGNPAKSLLKFMTRYRRGQSVTNERDILSIGNEHGQFVHGFFMGAAGFHTAVKFSRETIQSKGAKRSLALMSSVFGFIARAATDPEKTIDEIHLDFLEGHGDNVPRSGERALFLVTSLKKLGAGFYPFWGRGDGGLRTTMIAHPAHKLLAAAPWVTFGRERKWFKKHHIDSWNTNRMVTKFSGPYVFDGEIFQTDKETPLIIEKKYRVTFLT